MMMIFQMGPIRVSNREKKIVLLRKFLVQETQVLKSFESEEKATVESESIGKGPQKASDSKTMFHEPEKYCLNCFHFFSSFH